MCYGLAEARSDTVQDDVDQMMIRQLDIDIESIDIVQVFLHSTCLLEIPDFIKSPVQLVVVPIDLPNGIFNLLPGAIPVPISLPSLPHYSFRT